MPSRAASVASRMRTGLRCGVGLERGFDPLPVVLVHAAVHGQQPVAAREPLGGQHVLEASSAWPGTR